MMQNIEANDSNNQEGNIDEQDNIIENNQQWKVKHPIEISWKNLLVKATIEKKVVVDGKKTKVKEEKIILKQIEGIARPGQFTAILGPSGSGKTTLLNFLSGRLMTNNLQIEGELSLNGYNISSVEEYSDQIAYVMQDDILLSTFTPRESFQFTAKLRLPDKTDEERDEIVENLIEELGLQHCSNTYIGNHLIRGISGGERKRTSIGVELLTDPKVIFLDEPTTGLDSSTSKMVVTLLKQLSMKGVNVISTIHQPSSEIFSLFEDLILLVDGNIIYQGEIDRSVNYFAKIGFQCPKSYNPADYFMKLMNEEGFAVEKQLENQEEINDQEIKQQFDDRVKKLHSVYQENLKKQNKNQIQILDTIPKQTQKTRSIMFQFSLLFMRGMTHQIRNKFDILLKSFQTIIFAAVYIIIFNNLGSGMEGIQNRNGACFFMTSAQAFASITGTIASFSSERALYLRERANKAYGPGTYFWGRSLAEFPFQIFYPVLFVSITYYWVGLNNSSIDKFFMAQLICILTYWYGASYGFLISILCPKFEVAMALIPATIIPLMVLSGFFVAISSIPIYWRIISYVSMFRFGFEAQAINEFEGQEYFGVNNVPLDPLKIHNFQTSMAVDCLILFGLGLLMRIGCLIGLYYISNPKRPKLVIKQSNESSQS